MAHENAGPQRRRKAANKGKRARARAEISAAIEARIALAMAAYFGGDSVPHVVERVVKESKVSRRTAQTAVRAMFSRLAAEPIDGGEIAAARRRGEAMLLDAYRVAVQAGSARDMVLAAERVTQLAIGSAPFGPQKHEVSGPDGGPMQTQACPVAVLPAMELHVRLPDRPAHADATPTGPAGP